MINTIELLFVSKNHPLPMGYGGVVRIRTPQNVWSMPLGTLLGCDNLEVIHLCQTIMDEALFHPPY